MVLYTSVHCTVTITLEITFAITVTITFIHAISIVPLQVHYYTEVLPTQHGCCARILRQSATGNCEWKTCSRSLRGGYRTHERESDPWPFKRKASTLPMCHTHTPHYSYTPVLHFTNWQSFITIGYLISVVSVHLSFCHVSFHPSSLQSFPSYIPLSMMPCMLPFISPSFHWFIQLSVHKFIHPSMQTIHPWMLPSMILSMNSSIHPRILPCIQPSVNPSIYPSMNRSIHPWIRLSIHESFHLSIHPSMNPIHPLILPSIYLPIHSWILP